LTLRDLLFLFAGVCLGVGGSIVVGLLLNLARRR
jgi:hypothetical protein